MKGESYNTSKSMMYTTKNKINSNISGENQTRILYITENIYFI